MQRLFDYAVRTTAGTPDQITGHSDLMNRLEVSADLADAAQSGGSMNEKFIRCRDMAFLPY